MRRREFNYLGTAFLLDSYLLSQAPPPKTGDKTTLAGTFFFVQKNGEFGVRAEDVTIDGLSFPKFTWQWIGMSLAQGVFSFIGGQLFSAIANAIFGGTHQSLEQLLQHQLEEFARIVEEAITANEVQRYTSLVQSYFHRYREYSRSPDKARLGRLLDDTSDGLSNLGNLGFPAYRTYMSAASLRLSILQEGRKYGLAKIADFEDQVNESTGLHDAMVAYIDQQTTPSTQVAANPPIVGSWGSRWYGCSSSTSNGGLGPSHVDWSFRVTQIDKNVLGHHLSGFVAVAGDGRVLTFEEVAMHRPWVVKDCPKYLSDRFPDFAYERQTAKAQNTDLGAKMIPKWNGALKKMKHA